MTATAGLCFAVAWGGVTARYPDTPGALKAACLAGAVVWGASLVGVTPVALLGKRGVMATAAGYFVGMGIRLPACLGLYMVVSSRGLWPAGPVALVLGLMYAPLLFVEAALVGRYLWAKDFLDRGQSGVAGCGARAKGVLA